MQNNGSDADRIKTRHLKGFSRFQLAALGALSILNRSLKESEGERQQVKVGDIKSLVSAYAEAVEGERMVLGIVGKGAVEEEATLRWVLDESTGPDGVSRDNQGA